MKEKKFEFPEAIIVTFIEEDIIVTSGGLGEGFGEPGDDSQE